MVLARYRHLELIPESWRNWGVDVVNPMALAEILLSGSRTSFSFSRPGDLAHRYTSLPVCRGATMGRGDCGIPTARRQSRDASLGRKKKAAG